MAPDAPFVAITGTNGKSTTTALIAHLAASAGLDAQLGGNIGTAILSLAPPRAGRVHVIEMLVLPDRSRALARSFGRHPHQPQRRSSRPPRHDGTLCGGEGASGRRRAEARHRDRRRRRRMVPQHCRPARAIRQARGPGLGEKSAARWSLCRGAIGSCAPPAGGAAVAEIGGIGSLRGLHNAQNAACASAAALALGLEPAAIQAGLRSAFPVSRIAWRRSAGAAPCCSSTIPRRTNADSAAQALACFADIFWIAGGKPKTGGIDSLRDSFRASARPI
jgi:UDP-N-acetylmuramoylalanine--D-glutamate ligase